VISPCSLCKAECCNNLLITITSFDVLRIAEATGLKPEKFAELALPNILNFDEDTVIECYGVVKDRRGKKSPKLRSDFLLALKSRPCVFLKKNRCSIHKHAPNTCRSYPLIYGKKMTKNALCSLSSKLLMLPPLSFSRVNPSAFEQELNLYRHLVREWNIKHGNKKNCLRYLLEETKKLSKV
jgi:Fe-S-cluster containining protein